MTLKQIGIEVLDMGVKFLGYEKKTRVGIMTLKDGSKITTHLNEYKTPEGQVLVNLSNTKNTIEFKNMDEANNYYKEKIEFFQNDKEMYMKHFKMDEETWEEWIA